MKFTFVRLVALCVLLGSLGACANKRIDASTLQEATVPQFKPVAADQNSALIKVGFIEIKSLIVTKKVPTYPISIDGKTISITDYYQDSVRVSPGIHSILVGYESQNRFVDGVATLVLDAKPGITYTVMGENRYKPSLLKSLDITDNYLYIMEERTSKVVTDKVTDVPRLNTNNYSEPNGTGLATIRGTSINGSYNKFCYPMAIDGKYTKWISGTLYDSADYTRDFKVTPGLHPVAIGIAYGAITSAAANVFEFQPNTAYQIGCEIGMKRLNNTTVNSVTVWIENAATKEIVLQKSDMLFSRFPN